MLATQQQVRRAEMELNARTNAIVPRRVCEHFETAPSSSQTFSQIHASGSSRIHNGNVYYLTYDCTSGHDVPPTPLGDSSQLVTISHLSRPSAKRKRSFRDVSDMIPTNRERQSLATVLESLGQYSKSMPQLSEGEQGRKIAAQLKLVLDILGQANLEGDLSRALDDQVQDLKEQLIRTRHIKINAPSPRSQLTRLYKANSTALGIVVGRFYISLVTKTLRSQGIHGHIDIGKYSALRVQGNLGSFGTSISAFFGQHVDFDRTTVIHPAILAYNRVNGDAQVFQFVRKDDLDSLVRLIASGEASIRDCDESGRSLLFFACQYASIDVCRFLIDCGADVDRMEMKMIEGLITLPLLSFAWPRTEKQLYRERSLMCRKYLLQAGADPTIPPSPGVANALIDSALLDCIRWRTPSSMEVLDLILQEGSAFIDFRTLQHADGTSGSIWESACSELWKELALPKLKRLVKAGADTTEVDSRGQNCLFHCILGMSTCGISAEFEAIRFLLSVFDDVLARDFQGLTLFDRVEERKNLPLSQLGSYHQDVWYCALYRSTLALHSAIPLPPSLPRFTKRYQPKHYRALLFLDTWNLYSQDHSDSNLPFIETFPSSMQERQQTPGYAQWQLSDLLLMEARAERALRSDGD